MKYIFASDIHGSAYYTRKLLQVYEECQAQRLILLGDLLYHGPRNDLPKEYAPKEVILLLNEKKQDILAIRGNCDTEVDQMVLEFPILSEYSVLLAEGTEFFLTHGHHYTEDNLPPMKAGSVFVYGHTHIWKAKEENGYYICNPGSVSIPKGGNPATYAVYEDGTFTVKDFDGNVLGDVKIEKR